MDLTKRARITAYVVLSAYATLLFAFGVHAPSDVGKVASLLPLVVIGGFALYDKTLWHRGPLLRFAHRPYIAGTWVGTLKSYRRDEENQPVESEHPVALVIRQDFTTVSVTMLSAESKSTSSAAHIFEFQSNDFMLQYQYQNNPKMAVRDRSPVHSGGSSIEIPGQRPTELDGEYWTARDTRGTYQVRRVSGDHAGTFNEACQMDGSTSN
jgi:hypothetical protein